MERPAKEAAAEVEGQGGWEERIWHQLWSGGPLMGWGAMTELAMEDIKARLGKKPKGDLLRFIAERLEDRTE